MKVLVAVELCAYREAIGLAIEDLRPDVEMTVRAPEDLVSEMARLAPKLVICNRPDPKMSEGIVAWVELQSPQDSLQKATVRIGGHRFKLVNVQLNDLLSVIDCTEEAIQADRLPGDRYGRGTPGQ